MPELLITEACLVNYHDDKGGQHEDSANLITVEKKTADDLVRANRALFTDKKDDWDKNGRNTASKEMLSAAAALRKSRVAAEKQAPPEGAPA